MGGEPPVGDPFVGHKDFLKTSASSTVSGADKSVSGVQDLAEGSGAERSGSGSVV